MVDFGVLNGLKVVFIGGGNMASAIITGLLQVKDRCQLDLTLGVSDGNADKREAFEHKGVMTVKPDDVDKLLEQANVVVLAVKPQVVNEVASSLKPYLADKLVLSVLAGVPVATLERLLGSRRIVRVMPNLPASIGAGASGLYASVLQADKQLSEAIMASAGITVWVDDESHLHAVTAVAGSAPAYFFYVLEHMIGAGVRLGLESEVAKKLATQSMIGAGQLAMRADPTLLREQVTSKGGTTAAAIASLEEQGVGEAFGIAMQACYERSVVLGEMFD